MLKRTPLFEAHQKLGAKLIDFGGWEMPVQYTSIIEEHKAVREAAGLFDISHMGEFSVCGRSAEEALNGILTNDIGRLADWEGQYTQFCNEKGGVVDDLYIYRLGPTSFILVVNASRISADADWIVRRLGGFQDAAEEGVEFRDESDDWSALALQGPASAACLEAAIGDSEFDPVAGVAVVSELGKNRFAPVKWQGTRATVLVSRTGYTGEDGFEILCEPAAVEAIWDNLMQAGGSLGLKPCGLGARDTLRTEVCYPLYGHELDEDTTPIEAGIGWSVALDKGDFVGREALVEQKEQGVNRRLIAFKMTGRSAPPRPGYPIWSVGDDAKRIGEVTSGTQSPSLGTGIGLGYVLREHSRRDTPIEIEIRGRRSTATICAKPIYRKNQTDT